MDGSPAHSTLYVVPISSQAGDRWLLSDRYVEEVWAEIVGPTATLLARRLGRMSEDHPGGTDIDLADLASTFGVRRGIAVKALVRLDRFEIVHFSPEHSIIGVSGFAPSVGGRLVLRLSESGRRVHDCLLAASEIARPVPPGSAVWAEVGRLSEGRPVSLQGRSL